MRKEEFLEKLRARLSQTMSQQEVTAQIRYYENYIQEQMQNGRSVARRPMFMRNGADRRVAMHRENCIVWK